MSNVKLARALRAAASVLEEDEAASPPAYAPVTSLADRIVSFLENDTSGYHARSVEKIGEALGADASAVRSAASDHRLVSRQSRGSLGTLISLAD